MDCPRPHRVCFGSALASGGVGASCADIRLGSQALAHFVGPAMDGYSLDLPGVTQTVQCYWVSRSVKRRPCVNTIDWCASDWNRSGRLALRPVKRGG